MTAKSKLSTGAVSRILEIGILVAFLVTLVYVASFAVKVTNSAQKEREAPEMTLRIQLLNGCGAKGVANRVGDKLPGKIRLPLAIKIVDTDNFTVFDIEKSFVISRSPDLKGAQLLAFQLGLPLEDVIYSPIEDNYRSIQASVVLGKDYQERFLK